MSKHTSTGRRGLVHDRRGGARAARRTRARRRVRTSGRRRSPCRATRPRRARNASRSSCRAPGRLWSWTTNHYAPPEPYVVARPVRAVHGVRGRARRREDGRARRARDRRRPPSSSRSAWRWSSCSARSTRTTSTSTWSGSGRRCDGSERMSDRDIAILGVGMHPWGKWGRNFVEYGVVAAQAALADAGVDVARHPVRVGRRHDAQRLSRLRRGRDVRAGARLERRAGRVVVRRVRVGRDRARRPRGRRSSPGSATSRS